MNNFPIPISISISTFGRTRDQYPIELRSYVVQPKEKKELYIYAEITNGEYPVQNAYIWCEIYRNELYSINSFQFQDHDNLIISIL